MGRLTVGRRKNRKRKQNSEPKNNLLDEAPETKTETETPELQQIEGEQKEETQAEQLSVDFMIEGKLIDPTRNKCDACVAQYLCNIKP